MAIRKVILEGDSLLRKISKPVVEFDADLCQLLDDMAETMYKYNGVGLAAVQIGVLKNIFVIDVGKGLTEFVNPEIIEESGVNKIKKEGCLSVPGKWGFVERPQNVWVKFQDRFGNVQEKKFTGFAAKAVCHEYDHLHGILFTDRAYKLN